MFVKSMNDAKIINENKPFIRLCSKYGVEAYYGRYAGNFTADVKSEKIVPNFDSHPFSEHTFIDKTIDGDFNIRTDFTKCYTLDGNKITFLKSIITPLTSEDIYTLKLVGKIETHKETTTKEVLMCKNW